MSGNILTLDDSDSSSRPEKSDHTYIRYGRYLLETLSSLERVVDLTRTELLIYSHIFDETPECQATWRETDSPIILEAEFGWFIDLILRDYSGDVEVNFEPVGSVITADVSALRIVLRIMLENSVVSTDLRANKAAVEWTPKITVNFYLEDGKLTISVEDNGIGIPANKLDSVLHHGMCLFSGGEGSGFRIAEKLVDLAKISGKFAKFQYDPAEFQSGGAAFSFICAIGNTF